MVASQCLDKEVLTMAFPMTKDRSREACASGGSTRSCYQHDLSQAWLGEALDPNPSTSTSISKVLPGFSAYEALVE